jgi:hypothetical protein
MINRMSFGDSLIDGKLRYRTSYYVSTVRAFEHRAARALKLLIRAGRTTPAEGKAAQQSRLTLDEKGWSMVK